MAQDLGFRLMRTESDDSVDQITFHGVTLKVGDVVEVVGQMYGGDEGLEWKDVSDKYEKWQGKDKKYTGVITSITKAGDSGGSAWYDDWWYDHACIKTTNGENKLAYYLDKLVKNKLIKIIPQ